MRRMFVGAPRRPWPLFAMVALLCGALLSCTDRHTPSPLSPDEGTEPVALSLVPRFASSADPGLPIHRIRVQAVDERNGTLLASVVEDVDPSAPEWRFSMTIHVPRGASVPARVTAELIHRGDQSGGQAELVEWSGRSEVVRLDPGGVQTVEFTFYRGPVSNLGITGLRIDRPIPPVVEGDTVRLSATVEGAGGSPRLFWSSLDTAVATVDAAGVVRARLPGSARVVVAAGPHADTAVVEVGPRIARIEVAPDSLLAESLGEERAFTARALDPRGVEIPGVPIAWQASDPSVAESLGGGRFRARGSGRAVLTASTAGAPGVEGSAVLVVRQKVARVEVLPWSATVRALGGTQPFSAVVTDALGQTVAGRAPAWTSSKPAVAPVDAAGTATAAANGTTTITATVDGVAGSSELKVEQAVASVVLTPGEARLASLGATQSFTAVAKDANGHPVAEKSFSWSSSAPAVATVSFSGTATAVGNGTASVTAVVDGISGTAVVTVAQTPAALLVESGDGQTGTVAQPLASPLRVRVVDAGGRGIPGVSVAWSVVAGGGSFQPAASASDGSGVAEGSWTLGTAAGANELTAAVDGLTPVAFTATAAAGPAARLVLVTAPPASARSGVALSTQPVLQLVDAHGNPVAQSGVSVALSIASGGGTLGGTTTVTTDAGGRAAFSGVSVSGTVGDRTLRFDAPGVTEATSGTISLQAGPAALVAVQAGDGQSAPAGTAVSTPPSVRVTDAAGNPVAGVGVAFAVAGGGGSVTGAAATTDASGVAVVGSWTLGTAAGTNTLTATTGGLTPASFTATGTSTGSGDGGSGGGGSATRLVMTGPSAWTAGVPQSVTLTARDGSGNTATGYTGDRTLTFGGASVAASGDAPRAADKNGAAVSFGTGTVVAFTDGVATVTLTLYQAESATLTATDGTIAASGADALAAAVGAGPASTATSTVAASPGTVAPGGTSTVTVRLKDAYGNNLPASGGTVALSATLGALSGVTDNGNGTYTATYTAPAGTGTATISATLDGSALGGSATVVVSSSGSTASAISKESGDGGSATVATTRTLQAKVVDTDGNPVSGYSVAWAVASGGGTVSAASGTTDASGIASVTWTFGTTAGSQSATATASGLTSSPLTYTVNTTPGSASLSESTLTASPTSVTADGTSTSTILVQLRDQYGNNLTASGGTVALSTTAGTLSAVTDHSNGTYSATLTSSASVGTATVSGTLDGNALTSTASVSFTAGTASQVAITTQPSSTAESGVAFATQPVAQLRDANGNAVSQSGVSVTAAIASGGGTLGGTATVTTDASGTATFSGLSITGTVGDRTLSFSSTGLTAATSGTISVTPGPVAGFLVEAQGGGNIGSQTTGVSFDVRITARDGAGNTVTGFTGTADVSATGATLSAGGGTTAVFTSGVLASHAVTFGTSGTGVTLTATRTGGTEAGTSNAFDVTAAAPAVSGMSPISGPPAGGTSVTITGTNLSGATSVTFGGTAGTITGTTATSVTVTTPAKAAGSYTVTVTTPGGSANAPSSFTYQDAPTISGFSPTRVPLAGDLPVTITGTNLVGATVTFGGTAGTVTANTSTSITVTPPAKTAGSYTVEVSTPSGSATAGSSISYEAARYLVTASNNNPAITETVTLTAQMEFTSDGVDIPLSGKTVTWTVNTTGGTGGFYAGGGQTATSSTNASGQATITFTVSGTGGVFHTFTATDDASPSRTGSTTVETGIGLVGSSPPVSGNANNETTLTLTAPMGLRSGDLLIAVIALRTNNAATTALTPAEAGWTLLRRDSSPGAQVSQAVFYRWANGSESGQPYTWSFNNTRTNGYILAYRNVDTTNPFDGMSQVNTAASSTTSVTAPGVTVNQGNTRLISMFNVDFGGLTWTPPPGMSQVYVSATVTGGGVVQFEGAHQTWHTTGGSGTRTAGISGGGAGTGEYVAQTLGFKHKPVP